MEIILVCLPLIGMAIILSTPITLCTLAIAAYRLKGKPSFDALLSLLASYITFYFAKTIEDPITVSIYLITSWFCAITAYQWAMKALREAKSPQKPVNDNHMPA
jgi:hypothetical protein